MDKPRSSMAIRSPGGRGPLGCLPAWPCLPLRQTAALPACHPPHPRTPNSSVAGNDARTHGGCLFLIGPIRKRHIYLKNFPAARAKWLRNPIWKRHLYFKKIPAARAKWLRNPIRKRHIYLKISRCAGYMVKKSFVNKLKNEGDVMIKSDDFQRKNLSSVGRILGTQNLTI